MSTNTTPRCVGVYGFVCVLMCVCVCGGMHGIAYCVPLCIPQYPPSHQDALDAHLDSLTEQQRQEAAARVVASIDSALAAFASSLQPDTRAALEMARTKAAAETQPVVTDIPPQPASQQASQPSTTPSLVESATTEVVEMGVEVQKPSVEVEETTWREDLQRAQELLEADRAREEMVGDAVAEMVDDAVEGATSIKEEADEIARKLQVWSIWECVYDNCLCVCTIAACVCTTTVCVCNERV